MRYPCFIYAPETMEETVSITNLQDKNNDNFFQIIDQIMDLKVLL